MGFLTRLSQSAIEKNVGAAAVPAQGYLPTLGATPSASGLLVSQGTAMSVSAVYACVTIRSQDVARCTPRLFRKDATGKPVQEKDHPLARVFGCPNQQQTWFEFIQQMCAADLLRGNAYAAIRRDSRGQLIDLIPINPDAVLVLESWDGQIFYNVNRIGLWQIAMLREFPSSIAAENIFHLRGLSFNALVGVSTIGLARDAIGVSMGLEQQTARFMANGARPSMVIETDKKLSEDTAKRLKANFSGLYAGVQNTGGTPILEEGLKAKSVQLTSADMEFLQQRQYQVVDVARFFRVPTHKLGIEQLRGVNIVQMDQDYVNNTIMPDLVRWEQKFDKAFDLASQGLTIKLDETDLLRADVTTRFSNARIGVMSGWLAPNEVRAGEGLPPVEGGDEVRAPLNMAALGSDMAGIAPDGAGRPPSEEGGVTGSDNVATRSLGRVKFNEDEPRDEHGRWMSSERAIKIYTGEHYRAINGALRSGKEVSDEMKPVVAALDKHIKENPLPQAMTLYRGLSSIAAAAIAGSLSKGKTFIDPGFGSASTQENVARAFAYQARTGITMVIAAKAGARATDISAQSDDPSEQEVLIGRGAKYKVTAWDREDRTLNVNLL
jgi:HK97 family phage portal protein